jgi:pimeloyl-ACP methyl ester carboxylesterase
MTTVVMTHGAFCGGWTFERFRGPFEARGWRVEAPDLPGHTDGAPASDVAHLSMSDYARALVEFCADLPERPILVGHSLGGLVCQMAAARIRPEAMVLIAPSPPWGVAGSSIEEAITATAIGMMDPFAAGLVAPERSVMRSHSLDRLERDYREAVLARMRPESSRAVRETLNWWLDPFMTTSVGPGRLAAPTLFIAGQRDVVHPPVTVQAAAGRVGAAFRLMPGMSHWMIGEPGWETVADAAIGWIDGAERAAA